MSFYKLTVEANDLAVAAYSASATTGVA